MQGWGTWFPHNTTIAARWWTVAVFTCLVSSKKYTVKFWPIACGLLSSSEQGSIQDPPTTTNSRQPDMANLERLPPTNDPTRPAYRWLSTFCARPEFDSVPTFFVHDGRIGNMDFCRSPGIATTSGYDGVIDVHADWARPEFFRLPSDRGLPRSVRWRPYRTNLPPAMWSSATVDRLVQLRRLSSSSKRRTPNQGTGPPVLPRNREKNNRSGKAKR